MGPAVAVVGASLFYLSAPVENAILAQTHVLAMAAADIQDHLGMGTLRAGRGTSIRNDIRVKAVARVDAAEVDLLRQWFVVWPVSLGGSYSTPYSEFPSADATRTVAKIETGYPVLAGTG